MSLALMDSYNPTVQALQRENKKLRADNARLKAELAEAKEERDEIKARAMMLDRMVDERDEQLAAALAACEAKDAALEEAMGWNWLDDDVPQGIITLTEGAYHIKPDASILKAHDDALIERCAEVVIGIANNDAGNPYKQALRIGAEAIRELKGDIYNKT